MLGPVEAWIGGHQIALGGQRPRTLLALLALVPGRVVSAERLIDELWGDDPPARARDSLQVNVSRLRKALTEANGDAERLVGRAGGYVLELGPGARDIDRWDAALGRARRARSAGRLDAARTAIGEALAVWRGTPFAGLGAHDLLDGERARLEEERLAATIGGIELDLELGRHGELPGQVEALVIEHPFNERLVELQMLALYRSGRQADSLAAFHAARARFTAELGIEPGKRLRDLYEDIVRHADTLGAELAVAQSDGHDRRGLPVPPNRTIGRAHDLDAVGERLRAGSVRLLTLIGPGGVGKTRLALEAARAVDQDFADGARFISLAALRRPDDVPAAIVAALGMTVVSGESPVDAIERFLASKHLLLVVDNFEHVLAAAPMLSRLLEVCPELTVLATSREPLALHAERRYPVSPLALPESETLADPEALTGVDAVAMFYERARAHDPDARAAPAIVAEICRLVDGLPLAIELAAARCGVLSADEIAQRLRAAPGALGAGPRDAPARQQTLRATIEWSYDLLDEPERECFARFAVFAGGATIEAVETVTVASLDTVDHLVAKSLLVRRQSASAATRLRMLETIRAYATDRLDSAADAHAVRERHYRYYLALAERHGSERVLWTAGGQARLARLDAEIDNLHAALVWAIDHADAERALRLIASLGCYWVMRSRFTDALEWIDQALRLPDSDAHPLLRAQALRTKAWCLGLATRRAEQPAALAEMEAIARQLDDPLLLSQALQGRVFHVIDAERLPEADALADEALRWANASGDAWQIAEASRAKAIAAFTVPDLRERVDTAAALLTDAGNVHQLAHLLIAAAYAALCLGSDRDATDFVARADPIARALDDRVTSMYHSGNRGLAALLTGETGAALDAFREELRLCRDMVLLNVLFEGLRGVAAVAVVDDDLTHAATLVGAAAAHRHDNPEDPVEARLDATFFEPARARCGSGAWDAATREGSELSFEDAIAYALDEPHGAPPAGGAP